MFTKSQKRLVARIVIVLVLVAGIGGVIPVQAGTGAAEGLNIETEILADVVHQKTNDCQPGSGYMWANGPSKPDIAAQVQRELNGKGIQAIVAASSYGEIDSCGTYYHHGVDFTVNFPAVEHMNLRAKEELAEHVIPVLLNYGRPNIGKVSFVSSQGEVVPVDLYASLAEPMPASTVSTTAVKNVYVIVYDPLLSNGQTLSQHLIWNDHSLLSQQTVNFFAQNSNNRINYNIVDTTVVNSGWPELIDGFKYTESEYLAVWANPSLHHEPTTVDYNKIINSPSFDICGRLNRGEIDEVWIYNGPWFGFYESRLVGPGAYYMNSGPVDGPHDCNKIIPIMGPSVERTVNEAVHNFTHRTESTMSEVYGGWAQNRTDHNWDRFALVKAQSPNYSYSGCGSSHYPPNGASDYDYINLSTVSSNCDDFLNYPNLSDPLVVSQPVTCSAWGCLEIDYYKYWYGHMPFNSGCGPDSVGTDWWSYLGNPGMALYPSYACQADMRVISGNAGAGNVTLSYVDGSPKAVITDSYGNYFLLVSNHWSGPITPSKAGYTFSPAYKDYLDVQSDLYIQDYVAQVTGMPGLFVNGSTGDNNNSCTSALNPCRNIQEAVNKAFAGDVIYVAGGTYFFSTNATPNVVIINNNITLSGGWNSDFTSQTGASIIDGGNVNNGILAISGTVLVENFIIKNSRSSNSGAIYIVNGDFTLDRSTLTNNLATSNGAGIFLDNGTVNIVNSTISGNRAYNMGGGVYASNNGGASVNIQNSTIAYNTASTGGGIGRTNGTYNISNTIIANNLGSTGPDCAGMVAMANFNIIENMAGCSIANGSNNLNVDPQVDTNLTGNMLVHRLLSGSPAIDAGTATGCPAIDQQGYARPQGVYCDIGSIEYSIEDTPPVVLSITRVNPNPTTAPSVDCTVTFSEPVTGVDISDFRLTTSGISGAGISAVDGLVGSGNVYIVSVNTGSGSGTIRLDVVDDDSIVDATFKPLGGVGVANGDFTQGEVYTVPTTLTLNVQSIAANDGWVLESNETSNIGGSLDVKSNTFNLGDDKANKQYIGILHFDTSSLPDTAVITSATIKIQKQGLSGTDPFTTHGSLLVDIQKPYFGSTAGLVIDDFQSTAGQIAVTTFGDMPVGNWYSAVINTEYVYINLSGTTQLRLRFTLDDDNDKRADYIKFYSGNAGAANRPQLIIQYYIP